MKKLLLASAAALTMTAVPATAQDGPEATTASTEDKRSSFEMNDEQQSMYDGWNPDQQTQYDAWTPDVQYYYWDLEPEQQDAWWYLTDEQRTSVVGLTEAQQTQAWDSIIQQVNQMENGGSAQAAAGSSSTSTSASASQDAEVVYTQQEVAQSTPTAEQPSEYPVCESESDDTCIQPYAAGQRGAGVPTPLDYWPGQPASSM